MRTFSEIINLWPNAVKLAEDIGLPPVNVRTWRQRNSIPPEYWQAIIASAECRGIPGVTADALMQIAADVAGIKKQDAAA